MTEYSEVKFARRYNDNSGDQSRVEIVVHDDNSVSIELEHNALEFSFPLEDFEWFHKHMIKAHAHYLTNLKDRTDDQ